MKRKILVPIAVAIAMVFGVSLAYADSSEPYPIKAADYQGASVAGSDEGLQTQADDAVAEVTLDGTTTPYADASSLVSAIGGYGGKTFSIKLLGNINTESVGMFQIPSGSTVTLDLNGYSINRHKANASYDYDDNQEVIIAWSNAKLTIIDSDPTRVHGGYLNGAGNDSLKIWFEDEGRTDTEIKGGVIAGGASENGAGGITIKENATVTMKGGTIAGNYSYDGGGGVQLRNAGAKFVLDGGKIMYNGAYREHGGGIKVSSDAENGVVELISGEISYNWASEGLSLDGDGGGIYVDAESDRALYIHGSDTSSDGKQTRSVNISHNYAQDEGGGIYLNEGTSTILNAAIEGNKCDDGDGGGININDDGTDASLTAVTGCYISDNTASGDGGGIVISDENYIQIANCVITNNTAGDEGGGVYFNAYGDGCNMTGCTVTGNKAESNGGGIYLYDTVAIGGKMIVKDNTSTDGRNNLYNYGYTSTPKITIADLTMDSELYIHSDWDNDDVITTDPTSGSAKGIFGEGDYHFEKVNDPTSENYRHIVQKSGKAEPVTAEEVDVWSKVNKEVTAKATNLGYTMQVDESKGLVNGHPVYRGYMRFSDVLEADEELNHTQNYYYSDGLFFNDPAAYDKHLASLTVSVTLASGAATKGITTVLDPKTQKNRFNYLTQVFSDIGCTNESMFVNDCYMRRPDVDTMGVAMANKTIYKDNKQTADNAYLLVPVFVRSYNYGPEWVSNFTLGDGSVNGGEAQGFSTAADRVLRDFDTYVKTHPEVSSAIQKGRAILWLGGYSRGGAVTNVLSKRLTDRYTGGANGSAKGNKVFSYCIGTPQAGVEALDKEGGYLNIHNVICPSDIITYVGPNEMGFKRYGVDHYLPGGEAGDVKKATKTYGPDDSTLTVYSDNTAYETDFSSKDYLEFRKKFLSQLAATLPSLEFNDYFHAAEINYVWGNPYTSWIPIIGTDMIAETDEAPDLNTKTKFCQQFWSRLLKYTVNSSGGGSDWYTHGADAKDYRKFYATEKYKHFMPGSKYYVSGSATVEEAMTTLVRIAMGGDKELDLTDLVDISGAASDIALDAYDVLIGDLYTDNVPATYTEWIDKVWEMLTADLTDEQKGKGYKNLKDIMGEDISKAEAVYPTLMAVLFDLVNDDYNATNKGQYLIGTLVYNASDLETDHLVMDQWIRADDDWYAEDGDKPLEINTTASAPNAPVASISATNTVAKETVIADGSKTSVDASQKLYLRTQPGGAPYYTLTVDGKTVVDEVLYQGSEGIDLPVGKNVQVKVYAMAYDQKGAEATYSFEVVPAQISKAAATAVLTQYAYAGKSVTPIPVITVNGQKLVQGTDYTVTYVNNKNVGKAMVVITGKGKFTGKMTITFNINPKGTTLKKLKKAKKAITVKWKKQKTKMSTKRITGYQIQIAKNKKFTKGKKTITVKGFKKTVKKVKKLKAKKKYYVRVRTYMKVKGTKYYSTWSKVKAIKTK